MKMKSNYIYALLIFLLLVVSIKVFDYDTKSFSVDGIKYSVSLEGEEVSNFPQRGSYDVVMTCKGADYNWNYEEWVAEIYNVTGNVSCQIEFNSKTSSKLNEYIRNLIPSGSTTISSTSNNDGSTLEIVNNDYRYRGINPNNYIRFNGELWRIIGVFDRNTHGQSGENLVKIIRNSSLGSISWDISSYCISSGGSSGCRYYETENDYAESTIYELLNGSYYKAESTSCLLGLDRDPQHEGVDRSFTRKCDFTEIGLKEPYKSMVKKVRWNLGGYEDTYMRSNNAYTYERSNDDRYYYHEEDWLWGNITEINEKTVNNYVGLMYASDYGYAAPSTCTEWLSNYSAAGCADNNWLKSESSEWTLMHSTERFIYVYGINNMGNLTEMNGDSSLHVRPVLYLDSNVFIYSGTGTMSNPYIIGM